MSDTRNSPPTEDTTGSEAVKVNDRRRFDAEGNMKGEEPQAPDEKDLLIQKLQADLEASRKRVDELARAYQAVERDKEDFKQRVNRERERLLEVERGNLAVFVLEAMDELELSLSASDDSPLGQGLRMIHAGMVKKLESVGVQRVSLVGREFDPNLAEAADLEVTADPAADQRVISEIRPAYKIKERVIRPGRVKVARFVQPAQA